MRLIDADALIADLLTVDPRYTEMVEWCCNVIRQTPTIEPTDTDLISRADAIETVQNLMANEDEWYQEAFSKALKALPSADAVPQSEQYKKGFEDAKRAFLIEYARESEDMRKRNAQLEVMLNAYRAIAEANSVVRCKDCKYSFYDKDYESYNCRKHEYVECFDADDYCSWGERND